MFVASLRCSQHVRWTVQSGRVETGAFTDIHQGSQLSNWLAQLSLPDEVFTSPPFAWALAATRTARTSTWAQFFALMRQAAHVQACFGHLVLLEVCCPLPQLP